jgi:hypothetical protein
MKTNKTWKRVLSFALMVGIVVSLLVPTVSAIAVGGKVLYYFYNSTNYGTPLQKDETVSVGSNSTGTAKFLCSLNDINVSLGANSLNMTATQAGDWYAITINVPDAGIYDVAFTSRKNSNGTTGDVYILPGSYATMSAAAIADAIDKAIKESTPLISDVSYTATTNYYAREVTFDQPGDYVVVLTANIPEKNIAARVLTLTCVGELPPVATVGDKSFTDAGEAIAAIAAADANTEVKITGKLQLSADLSTAAAITVNEGAELDLNGKTLTATVNADGIVTDSGNGAGAIIGTSAVKNVGTNELALYDGSTCRIFDYTLTKGTGAGTADYDEKTDNGTKSVTFWYTFKFTNSAAYDMAMADGNGKLTVRAALAVGTASKNVELPAAAVAGWANKMKTEPDAGYAFYVTVTGFESLDPSVTGNLEVKLTVSGAAGTAVSDAASYTIG